MTLELRARAAVAALELFGFNPLQRRGPDGRFIKMGGAGSAGGRPRSGGIRSRQQLRAAIGRAVDPQSGPLQDGDREALRQMFEFTDPQTGAYTRLGDAEVGFDFEHQNGDKRKVRVEIDLFDRDGRRIGQAERNIRVKPRTDEVVVDHTTFNLSKEARGQGISSRWLAKMDNAYRDAGISEIHLSTTDVGGYAWAKAGFDFAGPRVMRQVADRFELRASAPPHIYGDSPEAQQQMRDLAQRARSTDRAEWPLPIEFAMVGWEPGATAWPGKHAMLGTNWRGVKQL